MRIFAWWPARPRISLILGWISWCFSTAPPLLPGEVFAVGLDRKRGSLTRVRVRQRLGGDVAVEADLTQCRGDGGEVGVATAGRAPVGIDEMHMADRASPRPDRP